MELSFDKKKNMEERIKFVRDYATNHNIYFKAMYAENIHMRIGEGSASISALKNGAFSLHPLQSHR